MPDQFTSSTGNPKLYRIRLEPSGYVFFIEAGNSTEAGMMVSGLWVAMSPKPAFNGSFDVTPATEQETNDHFHIGHTGEGNTCYDCDVITIDIPDWVQQ